MASFCFLDTMPLQSFKIPESVLVVIHTADLEVLLIERADRPGFWQSVTGSKDRIDEPFIESRQEPHRRTLTLHNPFPTTIAGVLHVTGPPGWEIAIAVIFAVIF